MRSTGPPPRRNLHHVLAPVRAAVARHCNGSHFGLAGGPRLCCRPTSPRVGSHHWTRACARMLCAWCGQPFLLQTAYCGHCGLQHPMYTLQHSIHTMQHATQHAARDRVRRTGLPLRLPSRRAAQPRTAAQRQPFCPCPHARAAVRRGGTAAHVGGTCRTVPEAHRLNVQRRRRTERAPQNCTVCSSSWATARRPRPKATSCAVGAERTTMERKQRRAVARASGVCARGSDGRTRCGMQRPSRW